MVSQLSIENCMVMFSVKNPAEHAEHVSDALVFLTVEWLICLMCLERVSSKPLNLIQLTKVWGLSIDRPIGDETHVYNLTVFSPRRVEANGCQNLDLEGTFGKVTSNHVLFYFCVFQMVCVCL